MHKKVVYKDNLYGFQIDLEGILVLFFKYKRLFNSA